MPFQPINFAAIEPRENKGVSELFSNIIRGHLEAREPEVLSQKLANARANEFKDVEEGKLMAPLAQSLIGERGAQSALLRAQLSDPFTYGSVLTGPGKEAFAIELLGRKLGYNSRPYLNASQAQEAEREKNNVLNQYRQSLIDTAGKRASTQLGKTILEEREAESGFVPGTRQAEKLSPEESEEYAGNYKLARMKHVSDVGTRQKALYASNIDKTLANIDPVALTQYAGAKGQTKLKIDELRASAGAAPQAFEKYQTALTNANLLRKQVRQFYGDSITPTMDERLEKLTNPATWLNNPKIARQNFEAFVKTLNSEKQTFINSTKNTKEFQNKNDAEFDHEVEQLKKEVPTWSDAMVRRVLMEHRNGR